MCTPVHQVPRRTLSAVGATPHPPIEEPIPLKFTVENITVTRAPLLKIYYWEAFDITGLNKKLASNEFQVHHVMKIPTTQINSCPFKTVFWIRNNTSQKLELRLRRIRNCLCVPLQTRVGFNQYRHLYHCPHRRLIHILQEHIYMKPDELVAISVVVHFFLFGEHKLTFECTSSDGRILHVDFFLDIIGFNPEKCLITKELLPIDIRRYERFVQPVWVHNITLQNLKFIYSTHTRGVRLINPHLTVPCQSVWPLMVQYRPCDMENEVELTSHFDCIRSAVKLTARGISGPPEPDAYVPVEDYDCVDFCYVIYPNKLQFQLRVAEERSQMVCIHNFSQKCVEFHWQNYIINDLFEISFMPPIFRLKPHHSQLCVVHVCVHAYVQFKRIPAVLEVHRILSKSTQIAKQLLEEIESIDDPKWADDSYMEHVFLHLDVTVAEPTNHPPVAIPNWQPPAPQNASKQEKLAAAAANKHGVTTIFEQLFWEHLSKSALMRGNKSPRISEELTYNQVLHLHKASVASGKQTNVNKNDLLNTLSQMLTESVRDTAKNWRFVPLETP